jgi:alkylation response protein AidB-like acyl-CoA dehydrogenase
MNLNEEQRLIRDSVRDYVQQRVLPFAADWDREGRFPAEQLREMAGLGGMGRQRRGLPVVRAGAGRGRCRRRLLLDGAQRQQFGSLRFATRVRQRLP